MSAAALWRVKGDRPFTFDMLQDSRFLRVFGIAVVLHMLWNSPLELPLFGNGHGGLDGDFGADSRWFAADQSREGGSNGAAIFGKCGVEQ
jgi:hypothetical protein